MKKSITIAILLLTIGIASARISVDPDPNRVAKPPLLLTQDIADLQQQIDTLSGTIKLQNQIIQEQLAVQGKFIETKTITAQAPVVQQVTVPVQDTKTIARVDALEVRVGTLEKAVTQVQVKVVALLNQTIDLLKKLLKI